MFRIVRRQTFFENAFRWEVAAPDVAAAAQPGHFVMLRLNEGGERIPLTVADFDRQRGTVMVDGAGKCGSCRATVILAMSAGRRATRSILAYLHTQPRRWPLSAAEVQAFASSTPLAASAPCLG